MGHRLHITCAQCGHTFERNYGVGYTGKGTLYCDTCGKAVNVDFATDCFFNEQCPCGGRYSATAIGNCPICNSPIPEENTCDAGQWK